MSAVLPPRRNDDEFITREEYERGVTLLLRRLMRIEDLCFNDETDASGFVTRVSLKTFIERMEAHRKVMCDWANGLRKFAAFVGALATMVGAVVYAAHQLGFL